MTSVKFDDEHNPVAGIDLGTTFSCIARWDSSAKRPLMYANLDPVKSRDEIDSAVYFPESGDPIVGHIAYRRYLQDPENGVVQIKREMGNPDKKMVIRGREYSPVDISAIILGHIRRDIEKRFPKGKFSFADVVVTHPLYFKSSQVTDTVEAARQAGLNLLPDFPVVPEPVAAALAYALLYLKQGLKRGKPEQVLVFDLGGGTFDTTVFKLLETPDQLLFEVLATDGDSKLGGVDFNRAMLEYVVRDEKLRFDKVSAERRLKAEAALYEEVEEVKKTLSATTECFLTVSQVLPKKDINRKITRELYEQILCGEFGGPNFCERIENTLKRTVFKAGNPDITRVLLVGGSSNIPAMETIIQSALPAAELYHSLDKSTVVALGAALFAAIKSNPQRYQYDKEIVINVRHPYALGLRTKGKGFSKVIHGNTPVPSTGSRKYVTSGDNVKELVIDVYQGEEDRIHVTDKGVEKVGTVLVDKLPPHKKGQVEIVVEFTVKPNLTVDVGIDVYKEKAKLRSITEELKPSRKVSYNEPSRTQAAGKKKSPKIVDCPQCRKPNPADSSFCAYCGGPVK